MFELPEHILARINRFSNLRDLRGSMLQNLNISFSLENRSIIRKCLLLSWDLICSSSRACNLGWAHVPRCRMKGNQTQNKPGSRIALKMLYRPGATLEGRHKDKGIFEGLFH